jgi:hypothetical protein
MHMCVCPMSAPWTGERLRPPWTGENAWSSVGGVDLPEAKLVHGDRQVPGLAEALVGVAVIHRD